MIGRLIPEDAQATLTAFLTAELSTFSQRDMPLTWPVLPSTEWTTGRILVTTSIGLPAVDWNGIEDLLRRPQAPREPHSDQST
jgi:hypothetical protein